MAIAHGMRLATASRITFLPEAAYRPSACQKLPCQKPACQEAPCGLKGSGLSAWRAMAGIKPGCELGINWHVALLALARR